MGLSWNTEWTGQAFVVRFVKKVFCPVDPDDIVKIGGEGKIVEVDQSKFAFRKYHRGHNTRLRWVFGE